MVKYLKVFYQNIRGIRTKTKNIYLAILNSDFDVLLFTETWLNSGILDSEFIDDRYNVFRRDRETCDTSKLDGGGVLIAVSKKYKCYRINSWETKFEDLWVNIVIGSKTFSICAVYIPSPLKYDTLEGFTRNVEHIVIREQLQTVIIGDFNIPSINWTYDDNNLKKMVPSNNGPAITLLNDFMALTGLSQYNNKNNAYGKILDLVLSTSDSIKIEESDFSACSIDKYHPPLEINLEIDYKESLLTSNTILKYNFINADYEAINKNLAGIDWESTFSICENVNEMTELFYTELRKVLAKYIPKRKIQNKKRYPIWYSKNLIKRLAEKNKYRIWYKKYRNPLDEIEFKLLRERCEIIINMDYENYLERVESNIKVNPKFFHSYLKKMRNNQCDYPALMMFNGSSFTDGIDICNQFANHFSNMYKLFKTSQSQTKNCNYFQNSQLLCSINLTEKDVIRQFKHLDVNKGPGPDNISPIFVKNCAVFLARPLFLIYSKSLAEGQFPKMWKKARVVPVFKSGDRKDITKYRPICILSVFSKVFESLVCPALTWHMKSAMIDNQHGFFRKRSTISNLALFIDDLSEALDKSNQIDCIYTDLAKAFDVVDHSILLEKLGNYGICGSLINWLESYLINRNMNVVIGGYESNSFVATSGVPQGSILGPVLFGIFINDIAECFLYCQFQLYADDLKMYNKINNINDAINMQEDINRLAAWCDNNSLKLNNIKCYSITFSRKVKNINFDYSIDGHILENVNQISDLGIIIDNKLSFIPHIDNVIKKALRLLGFIIRNTKEFKKSSTKLTLFNSMIRSRLEYCSVAWNPHYQIHRDRIERVQKKFLRYLAYTDNILYKSKNYTDLLKCYKTVSLSDRRDLLDLCFIHKIINGDIDCPNLLQRVRLAVPKQNARSLIKCKQTFRSRITRSNLGRAAPINRIIISYNNIYKKANLDIFYQSTLLFKRMIRKHFNN